MEKLTLVFVNERRKLIRDLLKGTTGVLIIKFTELPEKDFAKFEVELENLMYCFQLGELIGRAEVFQKVNAT